MTAVVAVFKPEERSRLERKRTVERLAHEIALKIREKKRPVSVILLAGTRLVFPMADTANCQRLLEMKGALFVGTYNSDTNPENITADLEATLSEYYEGRIVTPRLPGGRIAG